MSSIVVRYVMALRNLAVSSSCRKIGTALYVHPPKLLR